jgi:hypothetical protein
MGVDPVEELVDDIAVAGRPVTNSSNKLLALKCPDSAMQ